MMSKYFKYIKTHFTGMSLSLCFCSVWELWVSAHGRPTFPCVISKILPSVHHFKSPSPVCSAHTYKLLHSHLCEYTLKHTFLHTDAHFVWPVSVLSAFLSFTVCCCVLCPIHLSLMLFLIRQSKSHRFLLWPGRRHGSPHVRPWSTLVRRFHFRLLYCL